MIRQAEIDRALWRAHLRSDRLLVFDFEPGEWDEYVRGLSAEAPGYWHGLTGRLVARLGIVDGEEWAAYVAKERERCGKPRGIGDASLEGVFLIAKSSGLRRPGGEP